MKKITEVLIGSLSLKSPDDRLAFLVDRINQVIRPPRAASAENVNIRAMYVVNDLVNSHGGRFRRADLARLCELLLDTPVLVGHNRSGAPLARTFHAETELANGILWLKSYFFWPRVAPGDTDDLLLKIDSGILKECSISFTYTFPECSTCGGDIRRCSHEIDPSRDITKTHFIYNGITQVLETSLVYKGSVKGTHITDKLSFADDKKIVVRINGRSREITISGESRRAEIPTIIPLQATVEDKVMILSTPPGLDAAITIFLGRKHLLVKSA